MFLAILSILVTILVSPFVYPKIKHYIFRLIVRKRPVDLQVDKGIIPKLKEYGIEVWHHVMTIDDEGGASHNIKVKLINISPSLLTKLHFPIWGDAENVPQSVVKPWAFAHGKKLLVSLDQWSEKKCRGRVTVNLDPALPPKGQKTISWGYYLPREFRPGDEYHHWDFSTPHFLFAARVIFSNVWRIDYARWSKEWAPKAKPPRTKGRIIHCRVPFPPLGKRLTLEFGLSKKSLSQN